MTTILEVLTSPNVAVSNYATKGPNTTIDSDITFNTWKPWVGFNYDTLTRIFKRELAQDFRGSPDPAPLEQDLCIVNEATLEDLLRRFISPSINYALAGQCGSSHYGRGTRCHSDYEPDWSVISSYWTDETGYVNLLPGDTKLDSKWWPTMLQDSKEFPEWRKVVIQITTYMISVGSRYGFVITDANLVVFRLTRRHVGGGLAVSRSPRQIWTAAAAPKHQRDPSDASMTSADTGYSTYQDNDAMKWEHHPRNMPSSHGLRMGKGSSL
ncbi:hypothetical protein PT974_07961 [Cladobotryum mycophilum]|uniref:Uncharacterized protein n=1 Tax=Cladobotryum mycophilum TaxID=491253 RepID=A0ABR0SD55_9HYPO